MKALSLLQPWASLVVQGVKTIETRSWSTAYRGELLIHASTGRKGGILASRPPFSRHIASFDALPFGALIGTAVLYAVYRVEELDPVTIANLSVEEKAFGDYRPGRFAWLFAEASPLPRPVPVRGSLGLWEYRGPLD